MNKHTKGEWKVKHSESNPAFNVVGTELGGKYKIARCPYTLLSDGTPADKEEAEANAKLIAAAPELLEALILISNDISSGEPATADFLRHLRILAESAIKKATT